MNRVFLLLGGNLDDRYGLIRSAKEIISKEIGTIVQESSIYETAPWGFKSDQDFLNQVIIVTTSLTPIQLLKECQIIEDKFGRVRQLDQYASRTMDIDILFFNDEIINNNDLIIPHESLHQRRFTLEPLVELAPDFIHPQIKKSLSEIMMECTDVAEVKKL
ncbi:MAG: 2-amino-4-hydroxy-6-hydroxymethyldihydropteridine diphosphokinase [Bacteroidales bacterium]|jgi:2-amino-4-hydroxy-6-hydroxymethyldihydropteridine diphosphokinase|nr:2-amino-4-hydroxy-6-hydroxymethyldihydropteridine diphosphokinase [Bacteroidales bacterium]